MRCTGQQPAVKRAPRPVPRYLQPMPWDSTAVHWAIIDAFIEHGRPPRLPTEAHPALLQLAADHGVVLHPGTTEIWIAHPFSASPTGVWVERRDDGRGWWAPCIWCAMGIVTLAAPDAVIHTRYGGEAEPAVIEVSAGAVRSDACIHFPAAMSSRSRASSISAAPGTATIARRRGASGPPPKRSRSSPPPASPVRTGSSPSATNASDEAQTYEPSRSPA